MHFETQCHSFLEFVCLNLGAWWKTGECAKTNINSEIQDLNLVSGE